MITPIYFHFLLQPHFYIAEEASQSNIFVNLESCGQAIPTLTY